MVPIAAGRPTKQTTLYQSMQSQLVAKPSTVSMPKSKTVPGTGISIITVEKAAADKPLPVETSPANSATNTNDCTQYTGNVETKGSDNSTEHVATETDTVNSQVEAAHCIQNTCTCGNILTGGNIYRSFHPTSPRRQQYRCRTLYQCDNDSSDLI